GPGGRSLASDPARFAFSLLASGVGAARAANVETFQRAVGELAARGILYSSAFNRADNRLHASHTETGVERSEVSIQSLDEIMKSLDVSVLTGLKIDVQGFEEHVLRGAQSTLARGVDWIWIEFSPPHLRGAGTEPTELLSHLEMLGMSIFELTESGSLRPYGGREQYRRRIGEGYGDLVLLSKRVTKGAGLE